jgi:hypothetical protein
LLVDNTPEGIELQIEKHQIKAAEAKHAEDAFCAKLSRLGSDYLREDQQRAEIVLTPDVRFEEPTFICSHLCFWLEYKNYFGFRANLFVARQSKKQYWKYVTQIGPGAVVYKLGFETGHVNIDGVVTFREKEVLHDLRTRALRS